MTGPDLPRMPKGADRAAREEYLRAHAAAIYDHLTDRRRSFLRVDELCRRAAEAFPGLVPSAQELENALPPSVSLIVAAVTFFILRPRGRPDRAGSRSVRRRSIEWWP